MRLNVKSIIRTAPALLLAAGLTTTSVAPAQAFFWLLDPNVREYHDHFIRCKGLGFSNPAQHATECGPFGAPPPRTRNMGPDTAPIVPKAPVTPPISSPCYDANLTTMELPRAKVLVAALGDDMSLLTKSDASSFDYLPAFNRQHGPDDMNVATRTDCPS